MFLYRKEIFLNVIFYKVCDFVVNLVMEEGQADNKIIWMLFISLLNFQDS